MKDTSDLIEKMHEVMDKFEAGAITGPDARTYVAMLRTMLDAKKVEAAFCHLGVPEVPAVPLVSRHSRQPLRANAANRALA